MASTLESSLSFEGNDDLKVEWLDAIFSNVDARYGYSPDFEGAIQMTAVKMPDAFLDRVFMGDERQRSFRLHFLEHGAYRSSILGQADVGRIIDWCHSSADPTVWAGIATAVDLFITSGDEKTVTVSDASRLLLEACPDPDQILRIYADRISPNGWSGSRAAIMERNAEALAVFTEHDNPQIAASTVRVISTAISWVGRERERERQEDEAKEQRFE